MVLTYHAAVEAAAVELHNAHWRSTGSAMWALVAPACRHCMTQAAAVLKAVGYADLLVECQDAWRMFDAARAHTGKLVAEVDPDECSVCAAADRLEDATDGVSRHAGWVEAMRFAHHAHASETSNGYRSANGVLGSGPDAVIVDGDWLVMVVAERDALAATLARVKVEGDRWANSTNYTSQFAGGLLREALRPPRTDDE